MKKALMTAVVIELACLSAAPTISFANDLPALNSQWRETQRGSCFAITQVSDPLPGSGACVQIAGRMNERDLMIGYACERGFEISFFSNLQTDNSIKPDIYIGQYSSGTIDVYHCVRASNDPVPEYNCENRSTFKNVSSCTP
jgi:hypothetical protein